MNPHYEDAKTFINEATDAEVWDVDTQPVVAAMAQAEATLALAYEQRTANLISFNYVGGKLHSNEVHDQINERLGLA